jgi:preprotein translocase subunit SecA
VCWFDTNTTEHKGNECQKAYVSDVIYVTNPEFGFENSRKYLVLSPTQTVLIPQELVSSSHQFFLWLH